MAGWHHWFNGHEFEQARGVDDGEGSLACCSPWSCKESDVTEQLNSTDDKVNILLGMWGPRKLSQVPENGLYHGANRKLQKSAFLEKLRFCFVFLTMLGLQACLTKVTESMSLSHSFLKVHLWILVLKKGSFQIFIAFAASTYWSATFSLQVN